MFTNEKERVFLFASALAAVATMLCCIGPLVLVTLGLGGVWAANLAALSPYRPLFFAIAGVFLFLAYRKIYHTPVTVEKACEPGHLCASPSTRRLYKSVFWFVAMLIGLALFSPYLAALFY